MYVTGGWVEEYTRLMKYLKQQFSMENLLFLTILLQWEHYLCDYGYWEDMIDVIIENKKKLRHIGVSSGAEPIQLPSNVPVSPIIHFLFATGNVAQKKLDPIMIVESDRDTQEEDEEEDSPATKTPGTVSSRTGSPETMPRGTTRLPSTLRVGSESTHNEENRLNYSQFGEVFMKLYKQYIEAGRAPFEINISSQNRSKMKSYYLLILQKMNQYPGDDSHDIDKTIFVQLWHDLLSVCDEIFSVLYVSISVCQTSINDSVV